VTARYFETVEPIRFEGPDSTSPLAYRHYDRSRIVLGKTMEEHLRFAVCYWHSFCWDGFDVFGAGTFGRPWHANPADPEAWQKKMEAAFAFMQRLGLPFFCFHDVDVMAPARTPREHVANLGRAVDALAGHMEDTGIRLLWGTANLFSHPRYMAGGATNPDPAVFGFAALQVREALEATHRLGGENYVLWGGREGYDTLLNTRIGQEMDQLGRFLAMVVEHKHRIGFSGTILIEPKPHEPTKHQYDRDVATVYGFLKRYGLEREVKVNIEANHATLAGHSFEHEIALANALGIFGSIDMNRGDPQNGWDTDQFPHDLRELTLAMYYILQGGGFTTGGLNFDAKVRRQSITAEDMFHGHVGAVDLIARALINAARLIEEGTIEAFVSERYAGWEESAAAATLAGHSSLGDVAERALAANISPAPVSGRQELLENIISRVL
jgi:xylose isomerase